ncbi:MAG: T9SS type A sorting domain-containing protein [candidate division Zixibacteria bacterium]
MLRVAIILAAMTTLCLAQSPGETVGSTQMEMQEHGSGTNRIAVASDGGIYVCWMKSASFPFPRYVYWNYRTPEGNWWGEMPVSESNFAGYGCIDVGPDDCAYIFYHVADQGIIHVASSCVPYEDFSLPDINSLWPKAAIAADGRFHVISARSQYDPMVIMYNTSTDFGETWPPWVRMDSLNTNLWSINSSSISERTAIVEGVLGEDWQFDIGYIISEDGINWDISDWHLITDYQDSGISAQADVDLIFDNDDYLHVIWNTWEIQEPFVNSSTLWHWSEETGEISQIANFDHVTCESGAWNLALCKMSLGVDADDNLYCIWTGFASDDYSAGGYCNGDLYMSYSMDGGLTWSGYEGVTNSPTPGCVPGECDSDNWATLAEKVGEYLHIFYVNDKDAGAIPFEEGAVTDNPVLYLEVPNPARTGIDGKETLPENLLLFSNYPNPFNARTTIKFSLAEAANVKLQIFDIAGRLVETLADCEFAAGENSVTWDAADRSSGIYFARLTAGDVKSSKKLLLLK